MYLYLVHVQVVCDFCCFLFLFLLFSTPLSLYPHPLFSLPPLPPQVVGLNFSSVTTPELLLKTFDHYCEYKRTPNGVVMAPAQLGSGMVLFCDEINLPDLDKYGEREGEGDSVGEGEEEKTRERVGKTGEGEGREGGERKRKK